MRVTVRKRSLISSFVRSDRCGLTRSGETRIWPGRRGLRFTKAKECLVTWKTYRLSLAMVQVWYVGGEVVYLG